MQIFVIILLFTEESTECDRGVLMDYVLLRISHLFYTLAFSDILISNFHSWMHQTLKHIRRVNSH